MNTIRDLRENKQLSQDKVAEAAGLTYSQFVRIEEWSGSGRTTQEEVDHVLSTLQGMEPGERKLAGRPFGDPEKQAAVEAARVAGESVAEVLGYVPPAPAPALEEHTRKELLAIAKELGLEGVSRLKKDALIEQVREAEGLL